MNAEAGEKDPWHIHLPGGAPFSFAGIWARNNKLGVTSCSTVTMPAGDPMSQLHDRQPVILDSTVYKEWLDPSTSSPAAKEIVKQNLDSQLEFHRVCAT